MCSWHDSDVKRVTKGWEEGNRNFIGGGSGEWNSLTGREEQKRLFRCEYWVGEGQIFLKKGKLGVRSWKGYSWGVDSWVSGLGCVYGAQEKEDTVLYKDLKNGAGESRCVSLLAM